MIIPDPIPPLSTVELIRLWPHARSKGHEVGELRRIGYYSRQDGLDCIWLVDNHGQYNWTADHKWVAKHFKILTISTEDDYYGDHRPAIAPPSTNQKETEQVGDGDAVEAV